MGPPSVGGPTLGAGPGAACSSSRSACSSLLDCCWRMHAGPPVKSTPGCAPVGYLRWPGSRPSFPAHPRSAGLRTFIASLVADASALAHPSRTPQGVRPQATSPGWAAEASRARHGRTCPTARDVRIQSFDNEHPRVCSCGARSGPALIRNIRATSGIRSVDRLGCRTRCCMFERPKSGLVFACSVAGACTLGYS